MKRIVIDARESGSSTGRYIDKLVEYLHKLSPKYEIIVLAKHDRLKFLKGIAPKFKIVETPFKEFTFSEQIGFMRQIESLKPDLVFFPAVQQPVFYRGKVVTTMQDLTTVRFLNPVKNQAILKFKRRVYVWVNKRVAHKSAAIITPSEFVKKDIVNFTGVELGKITVTYEAADKITDKSQPVRGLANKQFIMYVGRPMPHKNLWRLIEAFEKLKAAHPDLKLVLAGKKDVLYEQIEERVQKAGISGVVFTGFVSEGQLRWLYEHCAAYIFPSLSEGFGLPALEAMQHGAPVVSSNATCLPEISGAAAHYFNPLDVGDMARAIGEVLDDKDIRSKLIKAGKKRAGQFSWKRMAEQTLAVFNRIIKD